MAKTLSQLVNEANSAVEAIGVSKAREWVGNPDVVFLDVREASEVSRTGKIPGAVHVPRGLLEFCADSDSPFHRPGINRTKRIVVVCGVGSRSALAARTLKEMGFADVWNLAGGMLAWMDGRGPIRRSIWYRLRLLFCDWRERRKGARRRRSGKAPHRVKTEVSDEVRVSALQVPPTARKRGATDQARATYQRIARFYDLLDLYFEYWRYRPLRERLFRDLSGRVLDAGVGTGRNMRFYPPEAEVVGIDHSPAMLRFAARRRDRLGARAELLERNVIETSFPDGYFDAVVATFLFCVLDETLQLSALLELRRICKPSGSIRILEYAFPKSRWRRSIMYLWAPWVRWAYGAAFDRNTEQYAEAAGLEIREQRFLYRDILKLIVLRPSCFLSTQIGGPVGEAEQLDRVKSTFDQA